MRLPREVKAPQLAGEYLSRKQCFDGPHMRVPGGFRRSSTEAGSPPWQPPSRMLRAELLNTGFPRSCSGTLFCGAEAQQRLPSSNAAFLRAMLGRTMTEPRHPCQSTPV